MLSIFVDLRMYLCSYLKDYFVDYDWHFSFFHHFEYIILLPYVLHSFVCVCVYVCGKSLLFLKFLLYVPNCFPRDAFKIFLCSLSFIYLFSDLVWLLIKSISSTVNSLWCRSAEAQYWACAQSPWHQNLSRYNSSFSLSLFGYFLLTIPC